MTPTLSLAQSKKNVVKKLPAKTPKKRTFIDFTESRDGDAVIFKSLSPLNKALIKSDSDLEAAGQVTEVRSRSILPAPRGDSAEPLSALRTTPPAQRPPVSVRKNSTPTSVQIRAQAVPAAPKVPPAVASAKPTPPTAAPTPAPEQAPISAPAPVQFPALADETMEIKSADPIVTSPSVASSPAILELRVREEAPMPSPRTTFFVRTGYLSADYGKYDDRMSDGATSFGFASAREFETDLGALEGRAAIDVFHATDQSLSVANIRMISLRADATRWLTSSRVKPGLSLGAGWTESSIRSYRSRTGADSTPGDVTVRTHAEGQSFSVIPAATLRVELSKQFKVDIQAEYLALFGSDVAQAARGAALTVSFGWSNF